MLGDSQSRFCFFKAFDSTIDADDKVNHVSKQDGEGEHTLVSFYTASTESVSPTVRSTSLATE